MRPAILCVHQIGKVGSTTVAQALQRMLPDQEIHQTHFLSERGVLKCMEWWLNRAQSPRFRLADHVSRSIELRRHFVRRQQSVNWYLFTLVREPIGRNVSAFFQNLHKTWTYRLPSAEQQTCRRILKGDAEPVSEDERNALVASLIELFKAEYGARLHDEWFDAEIRDLFGIDVFATPFPAEKGYEIYEKENARLVLVRLEDLRRVFIPVVREWLEDSGLAPIGLDSIELESERANDGSSKAYADLYRTFRRELQMDAAELDRAFESRVVKHFYTDAERANFL
ncbi:MAG: putative capsular polysaccharide synthesis family protein, partial [Chthoniobacterales bacterium]